MMASSSVAPAPAAAAAAAVPAVVNQVIADPAAPDPAVAAQREAAAPAPASIFLCCQQQNGPLSRGRRAWPCQKQ